MTDWQPIETAPKDGTPILIFQPDASVPIYICEWSLGEWTEAAGEQYTKWSHPTHWMPLPDAPRT